MSKKINLIYDGLNILIPTLHVRGLYNSQMFNVFPVIYFFRRIFRDILYFLDYFEIEKMDVNKFELLVKNNIINFLIHDNVDIYIVFDFGSDIAKRKLMKTYKEQRESRKKVSLHEDLEKQITLYRDLLYNLFPLLGYKAIIVPFVEADVIIGYIVNKFKENFNIIISNDSDLLELLNNNVIIYDHKQNSVIEDDLKNRKEKFYKLNYIKDKSLRFYPSLSNIAYFKSILGDKIDNIPRIVDQNKFRILMNYLIRNKIEKIENIEEFIKILKEKLKFNINETQILNNFHVVSIFYHLNNLLIPNTIIQLNKMLKRENKKDLDKFMKLLKNLELADYNLSWIFN